MLYIKLKMLEMIKILIIFIKIFIISNSLFCSISFLSFVYQTIPMTYKYRNSDNELHIGFPYEIFEQFYCCENVFPQRKWFFENIILNQIVYFFIAALLYVFFKKVNQKS